MRCDEQKIDTFRSLSSTIDVRIQQFVSSFNINICVLHLPLSSSIAFASILLKNVTLVYL
jgi:hypothetical protein